jgi:hypothetical protein
MISHQWLRELKRRGFRTAIGIYFEIPDREQVWAGSYKEDKQLITADEAAAFLFKSELLGYEVIVPRSIRAAEIVRSRHLPQVLGWRYYPNSNNTAPFCGCSYCQRGAIKSQKLRQRYECE